MADARKTQSSSGTISRPLAGKRQVSVTDMSLEARLQASAKCNSPTPVDRLTRLNRKEIEIIGDIRGTLEHLKTIMARVKTEGVKEDIDKLMTQFDLLVKSRYEVNEEHRVSLTVERAKLEAAVADTTAIGRVAASEVKILGALSAINERLDEQEKMTVHRTPQSNSVERQVAQVASVPSGEWAEVTKRMRKAVPKSEPEPSPVGVAKTSTKALRSRPVAVIVKRGEEQFPELLRTVRSKVDPAVTGTAITRMRQTQQGNLLIEINGGTDTATKMKQEIERSLGPETAVRTTDDLAPVEVRDLDEVTTKEEVLEATLALGDTNGARVVSIRHAYGGAQIAVVLLPKIAARKICDAGRIRVGLVYARVRPTELSDRCYRCLAFGHVAGRCTGVDRRSCCWRCGGEGHRSSQCSAAAQAVVDFRNVLANAAAGHVPQMDRQTKLKQPVVKRRSEQESTESTEEGRAALSPTS